MQIFCADFQICMLSPRTRRAGGEGRERRRRRQSVELADTETADSSPPENSLYRQQLSSVSRAVALPSQIGADARRREESSAAI